MRPGRAVATALVAVALPVPAAGAATVAPVVTLDGPSADVIDLGGVALADDGSGGIVYRRRVDGVPHIFAARLIDGRWQRPQQVDAGQRYASSWPRIVAARRGTLRVVWVQEFGPDSDRLYAATAPAGGGFGAPWLVDADVGEATATWPALAANASGQTYVAYRVLGFTTQTGNPPDGYVAGQIRLARLRGPSWSSLGILARNPVQFVRAPDAGNQPRLAVDADGNAVVAWQEPDDNSIDRVWVRRVFSSGLGIPRMASPAEADGAPLRGPADAFDLAGGPLGDATVVARVQPVASGAPRLFANSMRLRYDDAAAAFAGAVALGPATAGLGLPSVAAADGAWTAAAASAGRVLLAGGDEETTRQPTVADDGGGVAEAPVVAAGAGGASVVAWRLTRGGASGVGVRLLDVDGVRDAAVLSAPVGGPVGELSLGSSGSGDALVGFRQGGDGASAIAVSLVDGPPQPFAVRVPVGWVPGRKARVGWDRATDALGQVRYALVVDGQRQSEQLTRSRIPYRGRLDDGRYEVTVVATDARGQQTRGATQTLRVDGTPPAARVRVRGRRLTVTVSDGRRGQSAGVRAASTRIAFGDGSVRTGGVRAAHRYRARGRYRVTLQLRDRAGNRARETHTVVVR